MSTSGRRFPAWRWSLAAAAFALAGCPGGPDLIDPAGTYPTLGEARPTRDQRSCIVVYTATFQDLNLADDTGTMTRHTGYTIYTDAGQKYDYVRNYVGLYDTEPTQLDLEPGKYIIMLDRPEKQPPIFRVVIHPGKRTTVTLPR